MIGVNPETKIAVSEDQAISEVKNDIRGIFERTRDAVSAKTKVNP